MLTGAIGVEDAQSDGLDTPELAYGMNVLLGRPFADGVGRVRMGYVAFPNRLTRLPTVDGARRSQYHPPDSGIAHGFHQTDRAADIHEIVITRVQDGLGD